MMSVTSTYTVFYSETNKQRGSHRNHLELFAEECEFDLGRSFSSARRESKLQKRPTYPISRPNPAHGCSLEAASRFPPLFNLVVTPLEIETRCRSQREAVELRELRTAAAGP